MQIVHFSLKFSIFLELLLLDNKKVICQIREEPVVYQFIIAKKIHVAAKHC